MITSADCQNLDQLVSNGEVGAVKRELQKLNLARVPRGLAATVANLLRRTGLFHHSVRLLNRIVRAEKAMLDPATPRELAEYALALIKIGAIGEGRGILKQLDPNDEPQGVLFLAFSYFPEWDYSKAISPIETYLGLATIDPYQAMIAKVNLAAAYLQTGRLEDAEQLLRENLRTTAEKGHRLLHANLLELSAQLSLKREEFDRAIGYLQEAERMLQESGLFDELFIRKWRSLVECYRHRGSSAAFQELNSVRNEALAMKHWETVRDLDSHIAFVNEDSRLYHHLYHGTPHEAFRKSLLEKFSEHPRPPAHYLWSLHRDHAAKANAPVFDVRTLFIDDEPSELKIGKHLHRLLAGLTSDFYRPARMASLAAQLFEDEYYNPHTMPNRIHQLVKRLREWAQDRSLPLEIAEADGSYSVAASAPLSIRTTLDEVAALDPVTQFKFNRQLEDLKRSSLSETFTSKQAAQVLDCSLSTATRILNAAVDAGFIEKINKSARSRYGFLRRSA